MSLKLSLKGTVFCIYVRLTQRVESPSIFELRSDCQANEELLD